MERELTAVKKSFTKFEGQKTGWDVSIIGPEFQQNTAEAVLVTKEDIWTRYFFFFEDGLYKMFLAFNKDAIGGKNFQEFGKGMEAKYGHAKEVFRDDKTRGGVRHKLDHYEWSAGGGDRLQPDRPLRVLRRLLPGAVRRIGPGPRQRSAQGREPGRGEARTSWSRASPARTPDEGLATSTTTSSTASSAKRSRSPARRGEARRTSSSTRPTCRRLEPVVGRRAAAKEEGDEQQERRRRPRRRRRTRRRRAARRATTRWTGWSSSAGRPLEAHGAPRRPLPEAPLRYARPRSRLPVLGRRRACSLARRSRRLRARHAPASL